MYDVCACVTVKVFFFFNDVVGVELFYVCIYTVRQNGECVETLANSVCTVHISSDRANSSVDKKESPLH